VQAPTASTEQNSDAAASNANLGLKTLTAILLG
jgi:hypothetical protein